jgi:hypothetical protein
MMTRHALVLLLFVSPTVAAARADANDDSGVAFFEKKIRPVLVEHCYKCHSAEAQQKKKLRGSLRLDTRQGLLDGGDTGAAIVPGKAKESLLYQSLRYDGDVKMPPSGKLPDSVLEDFRPGSRDSASRRAASSGPTCRRNGRPSPT